MEGSRQRRAFAVAVVVTVTVTVTVCASISAAENDKNGYGYVQCAKEEENGLAWNRKLCPDNNACCPLGQDGLGMLARRRRLRKDDIPYGCVPNSREGGHPGVCCTDEFDSSNLHGIPTGCPHGYQCASSTSNSMDRFCKVDGNDDESGSVGPKVLPRYALCSLPAHTLQNVYGLPVSPSQQRLAYYSNMGDLMAPPLKPPSTQDVRLAIVVLHGSGRNADDYFCTAHSLLQLQHYGYNASSVLIVAPRFLAPQDANVSLTGTDAEPLRWYTDENANVPLGVSWRYGADSIPPSGANNTTVSSFRAIDAIVDLLHTDPNNRFPRLEHIVVVGHSAGGQLAHRWALLSVSAAWGDAQPVPSLQQPPPSLRPISVRAVAANPRSYTYLTQRRYSHRTQAFRHLTPSELSACSQYDDWQWGLSNGGRLSHLAPYRQVAIKQVGGKLRNLIHRYLKRHVVYLSGSMDVLPLDGTCEDAWQGKTRFERSALFFDSIQEEYGVNVTNNHKRVVVYGVDHDHAYMFQSSAGWKAIFKTVS